MNFRGDALKGATIYFAARALPAIGSFAFTMIAVQRLSSEQYGEYSLTLLPVVTGASFVGGISGQPMLRYATELTPSNLRFGLTKLPVFASLIVLPFVLSVILQRGISLFYIPAVLLLVPLIGILDTRRCFFVATSLPWRVFALDALKSFGSCAALILLFLLPVEPSVRPICAIVGSTLIALCLVRAAPVNLDVRRQGSIDRRYIAYGLCVSGWMAITSFMPLVERAIIANGLSIADAGEYAALSDPIQSVMSAMTAVLVSVLFPKMVAAWRDKNREQIHQMIRFGHLGSIAGAIVTFGVGAVIVSTRIGKISLLLSTHQIAAVMILFATVAWQIAIFSHKPFELINRPGVMLRCLVVAASIGMAISYTLMPAYHVLGVLTGKLVGALLYMLLVRHYSAKVFIN